MSFADRIADVRTQKGPKCTLCQWKDAADPDDLADFMEGLDWARSGEAHWSEVARAFGLKPENLRNHINQGHEKVTV